VQWCGTAAIRHRSGIGMPLPLQRAAGRSQQAALHAVQMLFSHFICITLFIRHQPDELQTNPRPAGRSLPAKAPARSKSTPRFTTSSTATTRCTSRSNSPRRISSS
jgi:hypothetical protein